MVPKARNLSWTRETSRNPRCAIGFIEVVSAGLRGSISAGLAGANSDTDGLSGTQIPSGPLRLYAELTPATDSADAAITHKRGNPPAFSSGT